MKVLTAFPWGPDRMQRGLNLVFCAIWLGFAGVFLGLSIRAHRSVHAQLPRAGFRLPPAPASSPGTVRFFQGLVNDLAVKHDRATAALEQTIDTSARTSFWLNLASAFLSVLGCAGQWLSNRSFRREEPQTVSTERPQEQEAPLAVGLFSWASPPPSPTPPLHEGSFPDSGYGR